MEHPQFIVPNDAEVLDALGVEPESAGGDETVRVVRIPGSSGDTLTLSYDILGRSVGLQLHQPHGLLLDLFYEGAERLRVRSDAASTAIEIDLRTESTRQNLDIQVRPDLIVRDRCLLA